ncbi:hypothetical protein C2857_001747 [Epichloe festucae Fl1]|uniref:RNA exonuclease 4 n=1 Tax=Epichloe festucae (strain Fl1) TaxID=877507 RepID=A0A7S9PWN7_EPIFF|nr:hypothetical protein C2857_001747 [Epichloe festucae Fl1]
MAELSSNWKKLQATLSGHKQAPTSTIKRKAGGDTTRSDEVQKLLSKKPRNFYHQIEEGALSKKMGGVHSSAMSNATSDIQIPSLELWTKKDKISSESLADVYNLGVKNIPFIMRSQNDKVNHGRSLNVDVGKYVAVDCEMVGVGPGGHESALARVSLVDFHGRQIYDSYVRPTERVTDWRSHVSGVSLKEMKFARDFIEVQKDVSDIIQGRTLIGHDIKHDLEALKLSHPPRNTRDTAKHPAFRKFGNGRKPALRNLAQELLGVSIQQASHSSTEDARVAMLLFRKDKSNFDIDHANRYQQAIKTVSKAKGEPKKRRKRR